MHIFERDHHFKHPEDLFELGEVKGNVVYMARKDARGLAYLDGFLPGLVSKYLEALQFRSDLAFAFDYGEFLLVLVGLVEHV